MKHGSRARGTSSKAHYLYISREGRYRSKEDDLKYSESGNMPEWAKSAEYFWKSADDFEASNARLYTEFEVAFPRELTIQQQVWLAQEFIENEIGARHAYTLAIHESSSQDGGVNPHMHLMFTTRLNDEFKRDEYTFFKRANPNSPDQGGARKDRSWMPKERLEKLRLSWEEHANRALERAGEEARIDSRSLKEQGIDRLPEPKLTPMDVELWKSGVINSSVEQVLFNREISKAQIKQGEIRETLTRLTRIGHLGDFSERATLTLEKQERHLKTLVERRETADRITDSLTKRVGAIPKTYEEALKEARTRLYGRAYAERHQKIKQASRRLEQARDKLTGYGQRPLSILFEFSEALDSLSVWGSAWQELITAQKSAADYLESMKSEKVERECKRVADQTLQERNLLLKERDKALADALKVRRDLDKHQTVSKDLRGMIEDASASVSDELETLSPVLRQVVLSKSENVEIGQGLKQRAEQKQSVKLELAHKLELSVAQEESAG